MDLIEKIKIELENKNLNVLVKEMGYRDISKGLKILDKILNAEMLFVDSNFDYNHYTHSFIVKLCEKLNIKKEFYSSEIKKLEDFAYEYKYAMHPYIFVNVNPIMKVESFTQSYYINSLLSIKLNRDKYIRLNLDDKIKDATDVINNHYQKNNGVLLRFEKEHKIISYIFHYDHEESIELFPKKQKKDKILS